MVRYWVIAPYNGTLPLVLLTNYRSSVTFAETNSEVNSWSVRV